MDPEDNSIHASAQKEQGREAGTQLVPEAKKVRPGTVVDQQLPLPYNPTVSTSYVADREERTQDAQRKGIPVDTVIGISAPELTTSISPFTGRSTSPPPDDLLELQSGRSQLVSRSSSGSSDDSSQVTPERFRRLKEKLRGERRYSKELETELRGERRYSKRLERELSGERRYLKELETHFVQGLDLANAEQPAVQVSHPIEAEQDAHIRVDFPQLRQRPSRCESDTRLVAVTQTLEQQHKIVIGSLQPEVKGLKEKEKEELLVNEDQFDKIYRFLEAKSNFLTEGNRCIVCDHVPDDSICVRKTPEGQQCNRPGKEHAQTLLGHKFKGKDKADKCNYKDQDGQLCGRPQVQHQDLKHNFKGAGLCESHLYPGGVLEAVCGGNNSLIYDGVHHISRTPNGCTRRLICDQCEPVTSILEVGLIDRMKRCRMETGAHSDVETMKESSDLHKLNPDDGILFSILAYRSMMFSLCHYQEKCCFGHRLDIKAILQYGWRCHSQLTQRYPNPTCDTPPVLLYLQSPGDDIPRTVHFPAVCELDLTATPPELGSTVVAIYGCIPPYHYLLLRDPDTAVKFELQPYIYTQQIILSINRRLSHEMKTYYEKNDKARDWLAGRRKELGRDWWPILTFGHLKCCLKIRI